MASASIYGRKPSVRPSVAPSRAPPKKVTDDEGTAMVTAAKWGGTPTPSSASSATSRRPLDPGATQSTPIYRRKDGGGDGPPPPPSAPPPPPPPPTFSDDKGKSSGKGNSGGKDNRDKKGKGGGGKGKPQQDGGWICPSCNNDNFAHRDSCNRCKEPRPGGSAGAPGGKDRSGGGKEGNRKGGDAGKEGNRKGGDAGKEGNRKGGGGNAGKREGGGKDGNRGSSGPQLTNMSVDNATQDVLRYATCQEGSKFLQGVLSGNDRPDSEAVFHSLIPHTAEISDDVFGNFVVSSMLERATPEQVAAIAKQLEGKVLTLAKTKHGCRVVQKLLETSGPDEQMLVADELTGDIIDLMEDANANFVMQCCVKVCPQDFLDVVIAAVEQESEQVSTSHKGCRIIQRLVERVSADKNLDCLDWFFMQYNDNDSYARLAKDKNGNYVVQCILEYGRLEEKVRIIRGVRVQFRELAEDKVSSNVVEKCIRATADDDENDDLKQEKSLLVSEILGDWEEGTSPVEELVQSKFGNYIVQCLIKHCDGDDRDRVKDCIMKIGSRLKGGFVGPTLDTFRSEFGVEVNLARRFDEKVAKTMASQSDKAEKKKELGGQKKIAQKRNAEQAGLQEDRSELGISDNEEMPDAQDTHIVSDNQTKSYDISNRIYVGGLSLDTDAGMLGDYFSQYGDTSDCRIVMDPKTGQSRGFGYITLDSEDALEAIFTDQDVSPHCICDTEVEIKKHNQKAQGGAIKPTSRPGAPEKRISKAQELAAKPNARSFSARGESTGQFNAIASRPQEDGSRIFVGGLPQGCPEEAIFDYFQKYGTITDVVVMTEKSTGRTRGFGFVTFEDPNVIDAVIDDYATHELEGKWIEVKEADGKRPEKGGKGGKDDRGKGGKDDRGKGGKDDRGKGGKDDRGKGGSGKGEPPRKRPRERREGDWLCPDCGNDNYETREVCNRCGKDKP